MIWTLHSPWGLLGLLSLPLIHWLHRYVLLGKRREISAAFLWRDAPVEPSEGKRRKKPPVSRVEGCELLCAALLSLWLAGLDVQWGQRPTAHLGLILDDTASMSSTGPLSPLEQAQEKLQELIRREPNARFTLIAAGYTARILGEARMTAEQAQQRLEQYQPEDSVFHLGPALTLAQSLSLSLHRLWILSDDPQLSHPRLLRIGHPQPNQAIVSASWQPGRGPFFAVRNCSSNAVQLEARWLVDEAEHWQQLTLEPHSELPLQLEPGLWEQAQKVRLELPTDALVIDNRATLLRPDRAAVGIAAAQASASLHAAVEKAAQAIFGLAVSTPAGADIVIEEALSAPGATPTAGPSPSPPQAAPAALRVHILKGAAGDVTWQRDLGVDAFSPLAAGLDVDGLVWYGQPAAPLPDGSRSLLSSPEGALIHHDESSLTVHVDLERSNWLSHPAFPILLSNLASQADLRKGGVVRRNLRQGEVLSLFRSVQQQGSLTLVAPNGRSTPFQSATNPLPFGRLAHHGLYRLRSNDQLDELSVNFLHAQESNLEQRKPASAHAPQLGVEASVDAQPYAPLRWVLPLLACVCLLLAWYWLAPRTVTV